VLQHVGDLTRAVSELARVTRPGGRVLAVEPDNGARYWHSSSPLGAQVFAEASQFLAALRAARHDTGDPAVGPRVSALFAACGIEPLSIQLFPVTVTHIGAQPPAFWHERKAAVQAALRDVTADPLLALGRQYLQTLDRYEADAGRAGAGFVEIQNTMLVATVGQKASEGVVRRSA
jgi:SAM-dependent methyltransferase